jgi:3-phenylpropionate/trans-cinnamate dioxygenase ferredoxin subunit
VPDHTIGRIEEFFPRVLRAFELDGISVAVVRMDDSFYAVSNYCSHMGVELVGSPIEGMDIVCWWHGSSFNLATGDPNGGPAADPLRTYPVRVEDGNVVVVTPDLVLRTN